MVNVINAVPGGDRLLDQYRRLRLSVRPDAKAHRGYVGGMWEEIGKVQIDFMVGQGLQPDDVFVDVACGSLRAGRHFISYLDSANYLGLDHNRWLIEAGLKHEIPKQVRKEKGPEFVVSNTFEFDKFTKRPKLGLAQSLFSHLTSDDIHLCLANLKETMEPGGRFFATFVPKGFLPSEYENPTKSDDKLAFEYDAEDVLKIGREIGWQARYIGDWGHPRGQEMLEFALPEAEV
ncbi:MAG: hypothetical protein IH957_12385 [Chloroflexi bacterium]|nr:hypothetical protein [Chloroflexota bacterium]